MLTPKVMKYLYAFTVVLVLSAGLAVSYYLGQQPQSIVRVTYHPFDRPEELTTALVSLLKLPLKNAPVVLLGVTPGSRQDLEFWKSFLEQNKDADTAYQAVIVDPALAFAEELFPKAVKLDLKNEIARFSEGVNNAHMKGLRMAVIAPTIYTSQLIAENAVALLETTYGMKPLSLSMVKFPRSLEEEEKSDLPCKLGDQNREGTGALGCAVQKRAKPLYKTKPAVCKYEGLVDQVGDRDYLIFWKAPETK